MTYIVESKIYGMMFFPESVFDEMFINEPTRGICTDNPNFVEHPYASIDTICQSYSLTHVRSSRQWRGFYVPPITVLGAFILVSKESFDANLEKIRERKG